MPQRFATIRHAADANSGAGLVALSVITGLLVGLSAALLIVVVEALGHLVGITDSETVLWWVPLLTIPIGLGVANALAVRFAPEAAGDGVAETAAALAVRAGYLPTRAFFVKLVSTVLTLGSGGSAGREGPMVQIGGTIGSKIGRMAGLGEDRVRSLVAAGAGAAIGASFNAPIAGMLFALEVILGAFAIRHLNAVVVTSVTAAVTARTILGSDRILSAFAFQLSDPRELVLYAGLGVAIAFVAVTFLRTIDRTERLGESRMPSWVRAAAFGLGVAIFAIVAPQILGDGQTFVAGLVRPGEQAALVWWALIGLGLVKMVATSLTLGARGSGGAFMPSLFIGASIGAGLGELLEPLWVFSDLSPGAFAVVGMAAAFAAVARAPLTSILIVFEITGDYGLVLPLMLATSVATVIAERFEPQSIYTMALRRMGISSVRPAEVDLLDTILVSEVAATDVPTIDPTVSTSIAQGVLDRHRIHGLAVVNDEDVLVGILALSDIARAGGPADLLDVQAVMTPSPVSVTGETPVSHALERLAALGIGRLPVVDVSNPTRLVAMFRREDGVAAYHLALERRTDHEVSSRRLRRRTGPEVDFFDYEVPEGPLAGRAIKQISWPPGCTVVSVHRGRSVLVPDGSTVLEVGDRLTVYGNESGRNRFIERLDRREEGASADRPTEIQ